MLLNAFTFHAPASLSEAVDLYNTLDNVKINAGGTFLLNSLKSLKKRGVKTPENIISFRKVKELQGITADDNQVTIKAMTTISDLFQSKILTDNFSIFKIITKDIATTPIRNMATVGGNLTCRYTWTELPAVMVGLDAQMHFMNAHKEEVIISAEDFFKQSAKTKNIFTGVTIKRNKKMYTSYQRIKKSANVDIPLISLFIKTDFKDSQFTQTKVVVNNGADFVKRDAVLEEFLNNSMCSETLAEEALKNLDTAIYEERSTDYKKHMFQVSIKKAIEELVKQGQSQ